MLKRTAFLFLLAYFLSFAVGANDMAKPPVFILLYTRFEDHTHFQYAAERIQRLLPELERTRSENPQYHISAVFQFSGAMSEVLANMNSQLPLVDMLKEYQRRGLVELGYTGANEPTPRHRPRPNLLRAETADARWLARSEAAERFIGDYKDPITGSRIPGLVGGLQRTQQVFGRLSYVSGLNQTLGGDSPIIHQLRRVDVEPVLSGFPSPDPARGIEEYGGLVDSFSRTISPTSKTSPDLYWEDDTLRSSERSLKDTRTFSTDEGPDVLKAAFAKMDRSRVRIIHLELGSYLRYLSKRMDGSPRYDPLEWAYGHPDNPQMPSSLKAFAERKEVDAAYEREEATLRWLMKDFFSSNPNSRFVSAADLKTLTLDPVGAEFSSGQLRDAASDLLARYIENRSYPPNFARTGDRYLSLADMFQLLSTALAVTSRTGTPPRSIKLTNVYGPLEVIENPGASAGEVNVRSVMQTAARLAGPLQNETWKPIPENVVPMWITVDGLQLNAAQFLRLMAESYLNPSANRELKVETCNMFSLAGEAFPRNVSRAEQGNTWTFRPAVLQISLQSHN
jgi:hypothetical protein